MPRRRDRRCKRWRRCRCSPVRTVGNDDALRFAGGCCRRWRDKLWLGDRAAKWASRCCRIGRVDQASATKAARVPVLACRIRAANRGNGADAAEVRSCWRLGADSTTVRSAFAAGHAMPRHSSHRTARTLHARSLSDRPPVKRSLLCIERASVRANCRPASTLASWENTPRRIGSAGYSDRTRGADLAGCNGRSVWAKLFLDGDAAAAARSSPLAARSSANCA